MKKLLRKILFGITIPQEYLCISLNDYEQPLRIFIKENLNDKEKDITEHQLLIGYKPLIIAIEKNYLSEFNKDANSTITLYFQTEWIKKVASLKLKLINEIQLNSTICLIFEGIKGDHSFLSFIHRFSNNLLYKLTAKRKKNIYLPDNLYNQVKIAYSVPRKIYLASVGSGELFNIFPTDLSGPMGENNFIVSLRTNGKACKQVGEAGKFLVAQINADAYSEVYNLGKNHMKDFSEINSFKLEFFEKRSEKLNLPVPVKAQMYYELEKINMFEAGIHTFYFCMITSKVKLNESKDILAHIHRDAAEWRRRRKIKTNYLLRSQKSLNEKVD
jgi:flavin reductase (DIM6/NTAB) family NADH-FMN oxidoreductase RutF